MLLICFDGSDGAKAAIEHAAELAPGSEARVLTVWSPIVEVLMASSTYGVHPANHAEIDAATERHAEETAAEGAQLANAAGLSATSVAVCQLGSAAATIIKQAAEVDATAIVVGSRGLSRTKSVFVGSVSRGLLHEADRPIVVVPSPAVVARRTEHRDSGAAVA